MIYFLIRQHPRDPRDRRSRRRGGRTVGAGVGVARYPESLVAGARQSTKPVVKLFRGQPAKGDKRGAEER